MCLSKAKASLKVNVASIMVFVIYIHTQLVWNSHMACNYYLQTLGAVVGRDTVKGFLPAVLQASKDPVPNCRFNASKALQVAHYTPAERYSNFTRHVYVGVRTVLKHAYLNVFGIVFSQKHEA
jgi:hypothetical protein